MEPETEKHFQLTNAFNADDAFAVFDAYVNCYGCAAGDDLVHILISCVAVYDVMWNFFLYRFVYDFIIPEVARKGSVTAKLVTRVNDQDSVFAGFLNILDAGALRATFFSQSFDNETERRQSDRDKVIAFLDLDIDFMWEP